MRWYIDFIRCTVYTTKDINIEVLVITGKGVHSKGNEAVLKPCVQEFLNQEGVRYREHFGGGAFIVVNLKVVFLHKVFILFACRFVTIIKFNLTWWFRF